MYKSVTREEIIAFSEQPLTEILVKIGGTKSIYTVEKHAHLLAFLKKVENVYFLLLLPLCTRLFLRLHTRIRVRNSAVPNAG